MPLGEYLILRVEERQPFLRCSAPHVCDHSCYSLPDYLQD